MTNSQTGRDARAHRPCPGPPRPRRLVGEQPDDEAEVVAVGRIVVGVDGSRASMAALRWAIEEARFRGAELETVHVFENTPVWRLSVHGQHAIDDRVASATRQEVATHERPAGAGPHELADEPVSGFGDVEVNAVMVESRHPEQVLVERSEGADMLVVGSRGLGGVSELLLGSVSHHCAVHAPCPLVIIRPSHSPDPRAGS